MTRDVPPGLRWPLLLWLSQLCLTGPLLWGAVSRWAVGLAGAPSLLVAVIAAAWTTAVLVISFVPRGRQWVVANRHRLAASTAIALLTLLIAGEMAVRVVSRRDVDGNLFIGRTHLRPFVLPANRVAHAIREYLAAADRLSTPSPTLGWGPRPLASSGPYAFNAQGLRTQAPHAATSIAARPGTVRIALVGDSFTHGMEVEFEDTWGHLTERALQADGPPVEVLNFGVPGYGMDQALLRWREHVRAFRPDILVFGLQMENAGRNLNLIRPLYYDVSDLPFSKPRFVDHEGTLALVNSPVVPQERLSALVRDLAAWPLARVEAFYDPADYRSRPWHASRFLTFLGQRAQDWWSGVGPNDLTAEEAALARQIVATFRAEVEAEGTAFVVVHLPMASDLRRLRRSGTLPYDAVLSDLRRDVALVETAHALLEATHGGDLAPLFQPGGHYSPAGTPLVADALASRLRVLIGQRKSTRPPD